MLRKTLVKLPKGTKVPNHIAVVMDGNGRWARSRGMQVTQGHEEGARAIKNVLDAARDFGVHTLTIWGFSTDNWKRPPQEIAKIMSLVKRTIENELETAKKEEIRLCHLGRKDRLPKPLVKLIEKAEDETRDNKKYILNIALDYGGRDEITRAVRQIVKDNVSVNKIDENLISSYLDTKNQPYPNPDLFIRTSGEQRSSGFLIWQLASSEFYFEGDHLPDMTPEKLKTAILDYSRRRRRFGGKDKMSHFKFKPEVTAKLEIAWWRLGNIPEGVKFREYAIQHIREQWGLSKGLAKEAGGHFAMAVLAGEKKHWKKSASSLKKFYKLIKDEVKLAFEPSLAASLRVNLWQKPDEDTERKLVAEVYRISDFQATKAAHLRSLATAERKLAEAGKGEHHWQLAENYLEKYYRALKDRVA